MSDRCADVKGAAPSGGVFLLEGAALSAPGGGVGEAVVATGISPNHPAPGGDGAPPSTSRRER